MNTQPVDRSSTLRQASDRFLADLGAWTEACMARYAGAPPTDGHDQLTYTTGWGPYIAAAGDRRALAFLKRQRDRVRDHFVRTDAWAHGYWHMQEAHHGTEHFELFLGALYRLDPADAATAAQLLDAAEHIGNWVPEISPWFDWDSGLFRSFYFGADGMRAHEDGLNVPAHLRCVNVCLLAHRMSAQDRYLDLAARHAGRWAEAILAHEDLPTALAPGGPVYTARGRPPDSPVGRADIHLLNIPCDPLGAHRRRSLSPRRRAPARRPGHPTARPGRGPRRRRDPRLPPRDRRRALRPAVRAALANLDPFSIRELGMQPMRRAEWPRGIGVRGDMPAWFEDGAPRRHNPITLALAAEVERDARLATCALDLARTYFVLARQVLPDGRAHGCAAHSVSAIARGHGRDNGAGMATAVLSPILEAFGG
jgi:hypothetical protein